MDFGKWRHYLAARLLEIVGSNAAAAAEYRRAMDRDSGFYAAAVALAYRCAADGRDGEAVEYCRQALKLRPSDCDNRYNLAFLLSRRNQNPEAIEHFAATVALNAKHDMAWYGMGLARAALGDHGGAAEALERAARLQPMGSPVWYQLAMACHHAGNPARVREVIIHMNRFDPKMARRLILDTGTTDLDYLVKDLVV